MQALHGVPLRNECRRETPCYRIVPPDSDSGILLGGSGSIVESMRALPLSAHRLVLTCFPSRFLNNQGRESSVVSGRLEGLCGLYGGSSSLGRAFSSQGGPAIGEEDTLYNDYIIF